MSALPEQTGRPPALHAVPEQSDRPRTRWNAAELMATTFPPPRWAVPGLISEGLNLMAGSPKFGKSYLSLGLSLDITAGAPALGSIAVEQGPVLYLALEDTGPSLQERVAAMITEDHPPSAELTLETECPTWGAGGEQLITEWLDDNPSARLVIIDTFEKVRSRNHSGGSAYGDDYAAASRIKQVADTYRVPILLIHHVRKATDGDFLNLVSGTNGLAGSADTILVAERPRGHADGVLHVTGRRVPENDYALSQDTTRRTWQLLDGPAEQHTLGETRATILRHLREQPGATPKGIALATDLNADNVRQTCRRMAEAGQLHVDATGRYWTPGRTDTAGAQAELSPLSPVSPDTA